MKTIQKSVPAVSAICGAFIDTAQISKIMEYADIFYQKRFIMEKEERIDCLMKKDGGIVDVELQEDI